MPKNLNSNFISFFPIDREPVVALFISCGLLRDRKTRCKSNWHQVRTEPAVENVGRIGGGKEKLFFGFVFPALCSLYKDLYIFFPFTQKKYVTGVTGPVTVSVDVWCHHFDDGAPERIKME